MAKRNSATKKRIVKKNIAKGIVLSLIHISEPTRQAS